MPKPRADTTRPVGRITAYSLFQKHFFKLQKCASEDKTGLVLACNDAWKNMNCKEKEHWLRMEEADGERYDRELKEWKVKNPLIGKSKRHARPPPRKALKPNDAPKHPLSAFFWWSYCERQKLSEEHPEYGVCEISKMLGDMWKKVSSDVRLRFELMAEKDKLRYRREAKDYKKNKKRESSPPIITID